jgi:hypothetical protein
VIYGLKNSLFIEQPSVHQRKFAQLDEEKRLNMDISEYKKLLKVASEGNAADSEDGTGGERPISSLVKNALGVAEKSKFKKNRPKVIHLQSLAFLMLPTVYDLIAGIGSGCFQYCRSISDFHEP